MENWRQLSSQVWKSGEMSNTSTGTPVYEQFVIDDDMDSDTTESNLSLESRSFLHRVNDRLRKMLDHSPEDSMQDIDKRSMICECSCLREWKHLDSWERIIQTIICNRQNYRESFHFETDVRHFWKVDSWKVDSGTIGMNFLEWLQSIGENSSWKYLSLVMNKSSVYRMQRFMYF